MRQIIVLLLILVSISCVQKSEEIGRNSIQDLSSNYECTGFLKNINTYNLIQSVTGNDNLEIQIWENQNDDSKNIVLVFIYDKKGYAIPLLPNIYKRYWNFEFDNLSTDKFKINTTFEKEYYRMLESLNIMDSTTLARKSLFKVFNYVIDCRNIYYSDSTEIINNIDYEYVEDITYSETDDSCFQRKSLIIKNVYSNIRTLKEFNAFWDQRNNRIYQINFDSLNLSKKFNPCLKIYRLDCNNYLELII